MSPSYVVGFAKIINKLKIVLDCIETRGCVYKTGLPGSANSHRACLPMENSMEVP